MPRSLPFLIGLLVAALVCPGAVGAPSAAGDPTRIVYVHGTEMIAVAPSGSLRRVIARVPKGVVDVAASADGRRFALLVNRGVRVGERGSDRALYLLRPGGRPRLVDIWHDLGPLSVALSPEGDRVAFARRRQIWVRRLDSGRTARATSVAGIAGEPAFAPGDSLVFSWTRTREPGLYRTSWTDLIRSCLGTAQ